MFRRRRPPQSRTASATPGPIEIMRLAGEEMTEFAERCGARCAGPVMGGRLAGIIDWTPKLGDPAEDFSWLFFCRSLPFVRRALDAYALEADEGLHDRTIFLARCRALDWVAGAIRTPWGPEMYLPILRRTFVAA